MKKDLGIAILLLVLCGIAFFLNPRFLSAYNLQNTARLIGMYGIFSIGLGIVIITGGIDLSVGSVFALQGVVLAVMLRGGSLTLVPEMRFSENFVIHTLALNISEMPWVVAVLLSQLWRGTARRPRRKSPYHRRCRDRNTAPATSQRPSIPQPKPRPPGRRLKPTRTARSGSSGQRSFPTYQRQ